MVVYKLSTNCIVGWKSIKRRNILSIKHPGGLLSSEPSGGGKGVEGVEEGVVERRKVQEVTKTDIKDAWNF